jgi:hypothetical protein
MHACMPSACIAQGIVQEMVLNLYIPAYSAAASSIDNRYICPSIVRSLPSIWNRIAAYYVVVVLL